MVASKILKPIGQEPTPLELRVSEALLDLQTNVSEIAQDLAAIQFVSAVEVDCGRGKNAIVISVPVPMLKQTHKIQSRLVRELEKKFSDRHILFVAFRRILAKPSRKSRVKQMRPRSRTLKSVQENLLEDLVYPTEITGKRIRVKTDGSKVIKVKDYESAEHKIDTFSAVYKRLTGKDVVFDFPPAVSEQ